MKARFKHYLKTKRFLKMQYSSVTRLLSDPTVAFKTKINFLKTQIEILGRMFKAEKSKRCMKLIMRQKSYFIDLKEHNNKIW